MNLERIEKVAEAILYEGYMLYPYRASSVKNQQRWNFGVLYPRSYSVRQQGSDRWMMQTECLVKAVESAQLTIKVRFLQIVRRSIGKLRTPVCTPAEEAFEGAEPEFELVDSLEAGGRLFRPWQEAVEREITSTILDPGSGSTPPPMRFSFPAERKLEYLRDGDGRAIGVIVREWELLAGSIESCAERCRDGVVKMTVRVRNLMFFDSAEEAARDQALMVSLVSAHTILGIKQGEFLSLLDTPAGFEDLAARCNNAGTWPVLIGERVGDGARTMLSSPIILYDYPEIAPESAGNLFDATEIDEILSLRILTLTDEEKREVRQSDERAREILERTESLPEEQFMKLHGALRGLTPLKEEAR